MPQAQPEPSIYIEPQIRIHSSFEEARKFFEKQYELFLFDKKAVFSLQTIASGNRNLVVGEPGVGKSLLLEKTEAHLQKQGVTTRRIRLTDPHATGEMEAFLKDVTGEKALLLDALDEVRSSDLPEVIEAISATARDHQDVQLFVSSRWVFISRYAAAFPGFRYIAVLPFALDEVREYLTKTGHGPDEVNRLLRRVMSFGHRTLVIQIPRYLRYLTEFLRDHGVDAASMVSRNDLFEYFIYSKLKLEGEKANPGKVALIKRVLEKLALTMEIYQTNSVTEDELMTFFDDLKSDLKAAAIAQVGIEVLYDYSLLRVSREGLGRLEFENTEFQEYLAAKEITRFPEPNRAAFFFAVDQDVVDIYPTWYNTLTFLVDMRPDLLEQLVEFSGLTADRYRILDPAFLTFLSRIDPRRVPAAFAARLFRDVIDYQEQRLQRLSGELASALPGFFGPDLDEYLKARVEEGEAQTGAARSVRVGNIAYAIAYLLGSPAKLDRQYWRKRLIGYVADSNEDGVVRREALVGLRHLADPTVLDELPDLSGSDELFQQGLLSMCTEVAPDHPTSLKYFFDATRRKDIHARYGLYAMKEAASFKGFLEAMARDEDMRRQFLDLSSIFEDRDGEFAERIANSPDPAMRELALEVLVRSIEPIVTLDAERSRFVVGLWRALRQHDPSLATDVVNRLAKARDGKSIVFMSTAFFAQAIEVQDVPAFIAAMVAADERRAAHDTMVRIKYSARPGCEKIYEAGRSILAEEYARQEKAQAEAETRGEDSRAEETVKEFRQLLEPARGQYMPTVFDFYNYNRGVLDPRLTDDDRARLRKLIEGTVFTYMDPAKETLTRSPDSPNTYTTSTSISIFRDALFSAKHLGLDIGPFRQQVLNYIPFAYDDDLGVILEMVKEAGPGEMASVVEVYRSRNSDLWRHNPMSFIRAAEQYRVLAAAPVLQTLALEASWRSYERQQAITVATSLVPDPDFLKRVFEHYRTSADHEERAISDAANGLLITTFGDGEAIRWRLSEIVRRSAPLAEDEPDHDARHGGVRARGISELEDEIRFEKTFAKPLMNLATPGFEENYLRLLDHAMDVWAKGRTFQSYASYLWGIVSAYFQNLKEMRRYTPLQALEQKIASLAAKEGANWMSGMMVEVRRAYLAYLGKPTNIATAIAKYNERRGQIGEKIVNAADLFHYIKQVLQEDVRNWIEGEGAYDLLTSDESKPTGRRQDERLVQMTLKTQLEGILAKRGFRAVIIREPQLLDGKRVDFVVYYGFAGPVVLEVKLTSNSDLKRRNLEGAPSYGSMHRYMQGFGAKHGIFMVIDNAQSRNLEGIVTAYQKIEGVTVLPFKCGDGEQKSTPRKGRKKAAKHPARRPGAQSPRGARSRPGKHGRKQ